MGQKSRLKQIRRQHEQQLAARARRVHEQSLGTPEREAMLASAETPEALAIAERDKPAQVARLRAARWKQRVDGDDGCGMWDHPRRLRIIHSVSTEPDGNVWGHVSLSQADDALPSWYELRDAHWLLYPEHTGLIVVVPETAHVNEANVMHVWTCLTADPVPDFRKLGSV